MGGGSCRDGGKEGAAGAVVRLASSAVSTARALAASGRLIAFNCERLARKVLEPWERCPHLRCALRAP